MTNDPPRLRMFAGPNGSGKTTVKNGIDRASSWFGIYINPDEIEFTLRSTSGELPWFFAETTGGNKIELKSSEIPNWFSAVWDSFDS